MKKAFLFARVALKFIAWAVIPFLIFSCTTAKTVQNKSHLAVDTVIIHTTDTIQRMMWSVRTDTLRERIRERDSTSLRQQGDTIIREIWHWRESFTESSRTVWDSLTLSFRSLRDSLRASQRQDTQKDVEIRRNIPSWKKMAIFLIIILLGIWFFITHARIES